MKLEQIENEHSVLVEELTRLGAGCSLVERTFLHPSDLSRLEEAEKKYGQERLRKLCVGIMARYLLLLKNNPRYFDYATENHVHRALFNNGIDDKDLKYWMMFPRKAYFASEPKYPMPEDLREEIASLDNSQT